MTRAAILLLAIILAGCQTAPGPGPGAGAGSGIYREARQTCRGEARRAGFAVERLLAEREVRNGRGRLIGIDVQMRLRRSGRLRDRLCAYDLRTGTARLGGGDDGGGAGPGDRPIREARAACRAAVDREGWSLRRILSERRVTGSRGRVIGAELGLRVERRGRRADIFCDYTYDSRRARLRGLGGGGARPPGGGEMRQAERACERLAADRGMKLRAILAREPVRHGDGRLKGARIVLRVARGNRVYPVTCTYTARTGQARF